MHVSGVKIEFVNGFAGTRLRGRPKSLDVAERRRKISERFPSGGGYAEIAAEMGVSYQVARRDCLELGIRAVRCGSQPVPQWRTTPRRSAILQAVQAEPHRTMESFGQQFGVTRKRIRQVIAQAGLPPKPLAGGFRKMERMTRIAAAKAASADNKRLRRLQGVNAVVDLIKAGSTWEDIAKALRVHVSIVACRMRYARKIGLPGCPTVDPRRTGCRRRKQVAA